MIMIAMIMITMIMIAMNMIAMIMIAIAMIMIVMIMIAMMRIVMIMIAMICARWIAGCTCESSPPSSTPTPRPLLDPIPTQPLTAMMNWSSCSGDDG